MCHHGGVPPVIIVDMWSDVVCPFCYLGLRQLRQALARFEHADQVTVRHHAFELDPHAPLADGTPLNEMLAAKYSIPVAQAAAMNQRVHDLALELGMRWSLELARPTNTFDAHRVIALTAHQGRQDAMLERLFCAYFSEGLLVSDHDTLVRLAVAIGVTGVAEMLASDLGAEEVRRDELLATRIALAGVPALILNGRIRVSGAQGSDAMYDALVAAWSEDAEAPS